MKAMISASGIFICLIVAVLINSGYIERRTEYLRERIEAIDTESSECAAEFEKIRDEFEKSRRIITLSVSHDDITNIESSFAEIIGAAMAGDTGEIFIAKSRLTDALLHLGRLSGINLDSIM